MRRIPPEYKELGASIRSKRRELGIAQKDIAKRTHSSSSYVSQVELGKLKASDRFLWTLEEALNLPEGVLFLKVGRLTMATLRTLTPRPSRTDKELLNELVVSLTSDQLGELIAYARFLKLQAHVRELST